jgi:hypothetical protein
MRRHQPALLGGLFIGVLSSLPVVNFVNMCCCLWVVAGGVLTAYLQQQGRAEPVEAAEAALGGLIAGLVGALISVPISAVLALSGDMQDQMRSFIDEWQMPPESREWLTGLFSGPRFVILTAAVTVPVNAVFGMLGGLLGSAIFRTKTQPAVPPQGPGSAGQGTSAQ